MKRIIPFMLFLCSLLSKTSVAQNLSEFKKVDGLNSNVVYCVMQDRKGFIWLGTERGVARYDGNTFKHFTKEDGLSDNEVFQIKEDQQGRLWFLTYNGRPSFYDGKKFYTENNCEFIRNINAKTSAVSFLATKDGSIWYITIDTAYCIKDNVLKKKMALNEISTTATNFFEVFTINEEVTLFCSTGWYNTTTQEFKLYPQKIAFPNFNTKAITTNKQLYISKDRGIIELDTKNNQSIFFGVPDNQIVLNLLHSNISHEIWVCTSQHLYLFNTISKRFSTINAIDIAWYSYVFRDKADNIWITSLNGGLYFKENDKAIALKQYHYQTINKLTHCYQIQMVNHQLYAGYDDGELALLRDDKLHTVYRAKQSEALKKIRQILPTKDGLWLAIDGLSAFYHTGSKRVKEYGGAVKAIAIAPNGDQYFALSQKVVKKYGHQKKYTLANDMYRLPSVLNGSIRSLLLLGNDTLYAGGYDGLHCLVKDTLVKLFKHPTALLQVPIAAMAVSKEKHIVFATKENGIGIITKDSCYNIASGLNSNTCNNISVDDEGVIWIATAKGINRLEYSIAVNGVLKVKLQDYNSLSGLSYASVNQVLRQKDSIWMATNSGVSLFLPTQLPKYPPPIYLESLQVNGATVALNDTCYFNFTSTQFRFNFGAIAFGSQRNIIYRYKLDGLNNEWIETREPFATYAYIPPGNYTFYVSCSFGTQQFNTKQAVVHLIITPPFWQTNWFLITACLVFLLVLYVLVKSRLHALQKKQSLIQQALQLAKEKAEYEKDVIALQQQALRLQMNPHFIFNAIYAIQGYYAKGNVEEGKKYVARFATLLRIILDADNSKTISLENELLLLHNYLELVSARMNNPFKFSIELKEMVPNTMIKLPSMLVQPFVENAAIHGVAALPTGGEIKVVFEVLDHSICCTIEDNGIGRNQSALNNVQQKHVSKGINITEKRLQLFAKSMSLPANLGVTIIDKTNEKGEATGTIVKLVMPIIT